MKKSLLFIAALLLSGAVSFAQEQQWVDITALNMVATGQTDNNHALKQYVLINDEVLQEHMDVYDRLYQFSHECMQMTVNQVIPDAVKEADAVIADLRRTVKEHPEMKEVIDEQIAAMEAMKSQYSDACNPELTEYSMDTKALLKDVKAISVNKKAYTGYKDIGRGLYAVTEAPRYGTVGEDLTRMDIPESSVYTWGAMDTSGKSVIDAKYREFKGIFDEEDIIFLYCKGKDGKEHFGARGYDGRQRIPFEYDYVVERSLDTGVLALAKGGKVGLVTFDGKVLLPFEYTDLGVFRYGWTASKDGGKTYGVISHEGKPAIAAKYNGLWSVGDGEFSMLRPDDRVDVFDTNFKFLRAESTEYSFPSSGEGKG